MLTTIIRKDQQYQGTDELTVEFYSCHECGFERVPALRDNEYTKEFLSFVSIDEGIVEDIRRLRTAKYCPGCGRQVEWV